MWNPEPLHREEQLQHTDVLLRCPELNAVRGYMHTLAQMVRDLAGDRPPTWMDAVYADDLPRLHAFAYGLQRDHDAVMTGLTLSNTAWAWTTSKAAPGAAGTTTSPSSRPHRPSLTLRRYDPKALTAA